MALLTYARDAESGTVLFAIIADDEGADYAWPEEVDPWFQAEERLASLSKATGQQPSNASEWLDLASYHLGQNVTVDKPVEVDDIEDALDQVEGVLADVEPPSFDPALQMASEAFDQVSGDYSGFSEDVSESGDFDIDPQAMDNFVMMMLGPIDPEGPNGWILRAMDGEPREGDEEQFVHIPGTPAPGAELEERAE